MTPPKTPHKKPDPNTLDTATMHRLKRESPGTHEYITARRNRGTPPAGNPLPEPEPEATSSERTNNPHNH